MTDELNHDYDLPERGARDWHIPLNDNFRRIDADVEIRDRERARTEYRPKSGAKFLAIDTERAFVGDGERWRPLASSGRRPTFDAVQAGAVNGRRFVPAAEDLAGVQAAIDAVDGPAVVELEPGGEYVGAGLTVDHETVIVGNGATFRLAPGANTDLVTTPDAERRNVRKCRFIDLTFDGNAAENAAGNALYGSFWQSRFVDCDFVDAAERAVWISASRESTDDNVFERCRFLGSGRALEPGDPAVQIGYSKRAAQSVGVSTFRRCWFGENPAGVLGLRGNAHTVTHCKFYDNDGPAVTLDRSHHSMVTHCELATATPVESVIRLVATNGATARRNAVIGNAISNAFGTAIRCDAAGESIVACQVHDNIIDADGGADRGFVAAGDGGYRRCSLQGNVFAGRFRERTISDLPTGWTAANNVA